MITAIFLKIGAFVASIAISLVSPVFEVLSNAMDSATGAYDGAHYVFGNLAYLNSVLPITEMMIFAGIAFGIRVSVLGIKAFIAFVSFTKFMYSSLVSWRL